MRKRSLRATSRIFVAVFIAIFAVVSTFFMQRGHETSAAAKYDYNFVKYPKNKMTPLTLTKVFSDSIPSGFGGAQGFTVTDKYFVVVLSRSNQDDQNRIAIYDHSGKRVTTFGNPTFNLGHGNDLTWNSKTNEINAFTSTGGKIIRIGATDFKSKGTFQLVDASGSALGGGGIAYDKLLNRYYTSGGNEIRSFINYKLNFYITEKHNQVNQGLGYNNGYIYRPIWESAGTYNNAVWDKILELNQNIILQFDAEGGFTHAYYTDSPRCEIENISFYNNVPYILFNGCGGGFAVYKVTNTNALKLMRQNFAIKFDANGGTGAPSNQTAYVGVAKTLPTTQPTRTNYTFLGWATSKTATTAKYAAGASYLKAYGSSNSDITLYAVWKENTYTITYNANGGTGAPTKQTVGVTQDATISSTRPTRTNYTFLGWATSKTATTAKYAAGAKYTDRKDITLYAVWKANLYTISYDANGGTGAPAAQSTDITQDLTISTIEPIRANYTFLGWATSKTATSVDFHAGDSYTNRKSVTLYAVWKENTYTITYNANGGTGAPTKQTVGVTQDATISSTQPTRDGFTFLGWNTNKSATVATYLGGETYTNRVNLALYAIWKKDQQVEPITDTITLTYDANGGTGAPAAHTGKIGEIKIAEGVPTRQHYTFDGWSVNKNATSGEYEAGDLFRGKSDYTLYAVWKENTYTITYNANGGTGAPAKQTVGVTQDAAISSTKPTRTNYTFLGWATSKTASQAEYQPGSTYVARTNVTLYAVWARIKHYVRFDANGGTDLPENPETTEDGHVTLPVEQPKRKKHVFLGWSINKNDKAAQYEPGDVINDLDEDITLYAIWENEEYTILFVAIGGSNVPMPISAKTETVIIPEDIPVRYGYKFLGWAKSEDSTDVSYRPGDRYEGGDGITLYAVWQENDFDNDQHSDPSDIDVEYPNSPNNPKTADVNILGLSSFTFVAAILAGAIIAQGKRR